MTIKSSKNLIDYKDCQWFIHLRLTVLGSYFGKCIVEKFDVLRIDIKHLN